MIGIFEEKKEQHVTHFDQTEPVFAYSWEKKEKQSSNT